ncbi:NosD domain-containing protein [Thalassiella azotivora]
MWTSAALTSTLRAVAAGVLAVSVVPTARAAGPGTPACGDVLTQDTVLTADLVCPDGQGLVLGDGVTLDLGGHRLVGPGRDVPAVAVAYAGDATWVPGVAVRNGVVDGWRTGAAFESGSSATEPHVVDAIDFRDVAEAVTASEATLHVSRVTVTDADRGVGVIFTSATVSDSTFTRVGVVGDAHTGSVSFSRSTMRDSALVLRCTEAGCSADQCEILGNTRVNEASSGGGVYTGNLVAGNDTGIDMSDWGSWFEVAGNVFRGNGVAVVGGDAWFGGREVRGNTFLGNDLGYGGRRANDRLLDNTFVRNGDAVHVTEANGLELGGNRAYLSSGRGIHATGEVTDLGGNRARGNGTEPQCLGVTCTP